MLDDADSNAAGGEGLQPPKKRQKKRAAGKENEPAAPKAYMPKVWGAAGRQLRGDGLENVGLQREGGRTFGWG